MWYFQDSTIFPLRVQVPVDRELARALYNPKYKHCVYKCQLGIDFLGRIIICTGPHLGLCYDGHIWSRTGAQKLLPWEWWLGDGAYVAEPQVLSPCRKPPSRELNERELELNAVISHYRARVEHTNHLMESHAILKGVFRAGISLLSDALFVIAHTTNMYIHKSLRYPTFGNWPHFQ
eukprot:Phypoly_transcript_11456.p1 GENE.Phypoly_transcript_11456~~Phypoly_transcript_11456.p1  ORF type:complete len:177 (+),score=4.07 Phypoly_transcript_11456:606-1136(+)